MADPDPGYVAPTPTAAPLYSPAKYMKDYLIQHSAMIGWTVVVGRLPSSPDACVALMDASGPAGPSPKLLLDYPGLQVLVRSDKTDQGYATSYAQANKIRDFLIGLDGHPAEYPWLDGIVERGTGPIPVGWDELERHVWSNNFQLTVEPEPSVYTNRESL